MFSHVELNALNIYFLLIGIFVTIMATMAAVSKIKKNKSLYYLLTMIYVIGFSLVIMTNDWFIFLIGWELVTVSTAFMLVWGSKRIARQYFIIQFVGGTILLYVILIAISNGYSTINPIQETWLQNFFVIGLGMKSAVFGLHFWLPSIHSQAPAPLSAVLSGWVVKLGFIGYIKLIHDGNTLLMMLSLAMIFYGGFKALTSTNHKVLLAYSSISQLGFIGLGIASGTIYGYLGSAIHILAHALAKTNLFINSGLLTREYKSKSIYDIKSIFSRKKTPALGLIVGVFSLMGVVYLTGYYSKHLVKYAFKGNLFFEVLLHLASILTILYGLRFLWWAGIKEFYKNKMENNSISQYNLKVLDMVPTILIVFSLVGTGIYSNKIINTFLGYHKFISFHPGEGLIRLIIYFSISSVILIKLDWLELPEKAPPSLDKIFRKGFEILYVFSNKTRRFNSDVFFESYLYRFIFGGSRVIYHLIYTDFQKQLLWIPVLYTILLFWISLIC